MSRIPSKQIILDTDDTLTNNSDILITSQKAIKTYVDTQVGTAFINYLQNITGDNSATTFTITHSLNSNDILIQVYELAGNKENVGVTISRTDLNTLTVTFAIAPPAGEAYRVMIIKM